jgi:hypothetical protein
VRRSNTALSNSIKIDSVFAAMGINQYFESLHYLQENGVPTV